MKPCLRLILIAASLLLFVPLQPVPAIAQGTVIASDDFNRSDETPFAISGNWGRTVAGNYDGISILASGQVHSSSNEGIYYWRGAGTFDPTRQFARETVVQKNGEQGLVLLGGADQAIMVGWGPPGVGSTVYIYWYSGGLDRGQLATGPSTLHNGDVIEAVLEGGVIYAKVNGNTVLSIANTTTLTSGNPGFITYLDTNLPGQVSILDNWEAGTPPSYSISGTITENAAGLSGVLVTASGGFGGNATTDGNGAYTIAGVPENATGILLTPTLSGHTMSPPNRTVAGPVTANVTGQEFTSTENTGAILTVNASHGSVTRDPDLPSYPLGTQVTLTPLPVPGYQFTSWSGDVPAGHETDSPLLVTMDQDRTLTATFVSPDVVAADDFNRSDETPLSVGGNWVQPFNNGSVNLSGNQIVSGTGEALYRWQGPGTFSNTRQYARAHVITAGGQVGMVLLGGTNRALVVSWGSGRLFIYWYLNGSHQGELANEASVIHNGDVIEGVLDNGTIYAKINGVVVKSVPNTTSLTAGTPGFETFLSGAVFDDWEAGTPPSYSISGTITESAAGLSGVLVTASGGFTGNTTTDGSGAYTITGVSPNTTGIVLTPTKSGHTMSPLNRTVAGPVTANVTGEDFTSTLNTGAILTVTATHGSVTKDPDLASYPFGSQVTLTPLADPGYQFTSWSGDVPAGHETDNPLQLTMDFDRTLTASFVSLDVVAMDDFNRPDETPFAVGGNWVHPFNAGFALLSGHRVSGNNAEALYYWQGPGTFSNARQFARVKVVQASGQVGLVLLGAPNQALVVAWNAGTLYFYWYTGGSYQGNLTTVSSTLHDGDTIEARLENGIVYAKINNAIVASVANTTTLSAGRPGFETFQSGAVFDDWEAGPPATVDLQASAGSGGSIDPSGTVHVPYGTDQAFTITPSSGYGVLDVLVDGGSVGAVGSYTFTNVQVPHTIAASFHVTDYVTAVPAIGSAICNPTPCLTVPVVFTRSDATPLRGYSVTFELSPNLTLCGASVASAGYPLAPQQFLVTPLGGNQWTVDEATLGSGCGATGSGTLFTLDVSSAETNGTGTITILAVTAHDCASQPIPANPGAPAAITIDREAPAQTSDLVALQVKTGNYVPLPAPSHATTPVALTFTVPAGATTVEVYRRPFGGYPQYDENGGAVPAPPSTLPGAGWTLTSVTASGQTDEPSARDYWYYALVTRDAFGNASLVSNRTGGTLNYFPGDMANGVTACAGDDRVSTADLSLLSSEYLLTLPVNDSRECADVGPTTDHTLNGRPLTDNVIDFEDLVIVALGYGVVSEPQAIAHVAPVATRAHLTRESGEQLSVLAPQHVVAGATFEARVELRATGSLHALSMALDWNHSVAQPLAIRSGGFVEEAGGVTLVAGQAAMDGALLGAARPSLDGEGTFAIVTFRAIVEGDPGVQLVRAVGRDRENRPLAIDEQESTASVVTPTETRLFAAVPGPFSSETSIGYSLAAESGVELIVYGIDGRRVRTLQRGLMPAGIHRATWDGRDDGGHVVAAGVYYTRLVVGPNRFSRTLIKLTR